MGNSTDILYGLSSEWIEPEEEIKQIDIAENNDFPPSVKSLKDALRDGALCDKAYRFLDAKEKETGCHYDYLASTMFSLVSASVGSKCIIQLGQHKDPFVLFVCLVGDSGINKSDALRNLSFPTKIYDHDLFAETKQAMQKYKKEDNAPLPPHLQAISEDNSPEVLWSRVNDNPSGLIKIHDELITFFKHIGRYNKGDDTMQKLMQISDGGYIEGLLHIDRMGEGKTFDIENPIINIIGTTQPLVLREMFQPFIKDGGVCRWYFAYPDRSKRSRGVGITSNDIGQWWYNLIMSNYKEPFDHISERSFSFSDDAKVLYDNFIDGCMDQAYEIQTEHPNDLFYDTQASYITKQGYALMKFSAIVHLLGKNPTDKYISADEVDTAIKICLYYQHTFCDKVLPLLTAKVEKPNIELGKYEILRQLVKHFPNVVPNQLAEVLGMDRGNLSKVLNCKK